MNANVCIDKKWWKEAVVYQIYPRSFYDSNGDGVGDLRGIIEKLDYIKSLGVDVIWLNPVYKSPNDDNGYDISNYFEIMQEFGKMSDWEELLEKMHDKGLKMIMDLVVNHTSDEHQWFVNACSSRDSRYRDYYIWHDGKDGKRPNDWGAHFSGSAWEWEPRTGQYYLHLFTKKQPDLNWENEAVRNDIYTMMKWWLDRGIDGFRMDTINMLSKAPGFPSVGDEDDGRLRYAGKYFTNGPRIHDYLREMNEKVLGGYDVMTVGECPDVTPEIAAEYTDPERKELNMLFHFEHMNVDHSHENKWEIVPFDLVEFKKIISKWQTELHGRGWNSNYLMNHDQPRAVSRFGDDRQYRVESAKMLLTFLMTLEGTPYIYQGEEIGMPNAGFSDIKYYRDVEIKNHYREAVESGMDISDVMSSYMKMSRDNARTPMQWSPAENAGFTTGHPWIEPGESWKSVNVENDLSRPDSVIKYLRKLIEIRKKTPALVYGTFRQFFEDHRRLFVYKRVLDNEEYLIILNFSSREVSIKNYDLLSPGGADETELLISNYPAEPGRLKKEIRPWEAGVYKKNLLR